MILEELFFEVGAIIVVAAALAMLFFKLRQPLIIAYIIAGIVVGPSVLALTQNPEIFDALSKLGVAFLLFTVGLGLNWRSIKDVGGIALATGIGQVVFTSVGGYFIGRALGIDLLTSVYLAVAFSFSSTIIIVKLLSDKDELDSLYGRISVGFLIVQDLIALFLLLGLGALGSGASVPEIVSGTLVKGALLIPLFWMVSTYLVPRLVAYAARSQELLSVFAVGWCFLVAGILVLAGFNMEMGALIAGMTLSGTVFEREINARIRPLRDFFLVIFFVVLGTHLSLDSLGGVLVPAAAFSAYVLFGNPLIVLAIMRALGYHPRTGFLAGTTVAQISEFSFIVVASGIALGHVSSDALALSTMVGLATIAGSASMIHHNDRIYEWIRPALRWLEPRRTLAHEAVTARPSTKIYLLGLHNIGSAALRALQDIRQPFVVVDFDPTVIRALEEAQVPAVYGDASDEGFLEEIGIDRASFVISTIPEVSVSLELLGYLRARRFKGTVIVSARLPEEAAKCYAAGATFVIIPTMLGGEKLRELLTEKKTRRQSWERLARDGRAANVG